MKRIKMACNEMKGARGKAVNFIAENPEVAAFLSIDKLASKIGVSPSTLTRTAVELGYVGFPDMQKDIQHHIRQRIRPALLPTERMARAPVDFASFDFRDSLAFDIHSIESVSKMISDELFGLAVRLLYEARQIHVTGLRTQYASALFFYLVLGQIREGVTLVPLEGGLHLEWVEHIRPDDVLVTICLPRYGLYTGKATEEAVRAGCKVIAITDNEMSPTGKLADVVLTVEYESMSFFNSNVSAMALLNALATALALRDVPRVQARIRTMNDIATRWNIFYPQEANDQDAE